MKFKDCLKRHQRSPTVQTPTEAFNVGIVPAEEEGVKKKKKKKKTRENEQKLENFLCRKTSELSEDPPKTNILIHTRTK